MFCLYCVYYKGLEKQCRKGILPTDLERALECTDYTYNGRVRYDKSD